MSLRWIQFLFQSSVRNLLRAPHRTLISLLAIAASLCAMTAFESFVLGVRKSFRSNIIHSAFGHFKIYEKGYREKKAEDPFGFQITDFEQLRLAIHSKVAPLAFASRRQEFFGLLVNKDVSIGAKGQAIEPVEEEKYLSLCRVTDGSFLSKTPNDGIAIGFELAKQLGVKAGGNVTLLVNTASGSLNALDLTITGIYKTGVTELDENLFYVPLPVAQKLLRIEGASTVLIAFQDDNELLYADKLRQLLQTGFPHLEALHWHELMKDYFDNSMGWLESQFKVFRWILLLIATLSISNVFMMSIMERTGEFGTLRALGTHRTELVTLILTESFVQSLIGSLFGLVLGAIVVFGFLHKGIYMPPPPNMTEKFFVEFVYPVKGLFFSFSLCVLVGGLAGIFPALKIARLGISQALGRNI